VAAICWSVNFPAICRRTSIVFSESHHLEYRAEMFNTFNTANFGYPSATINTSSIGRIFGTIAPNRQIQMALRYEF